MLPKQKNTSLLQILPQKASDTLIFISKEAIPNERESCTCFGFLFISSASATVTARDRTMRVAFDAFAGFATVSANPLIFLVDFVFLKHISFCIYGPNSRLVNEA